MESSAFGGRVTFETTGSTLRGIIVAEGFYRAVPESINFTGATLTLFINLIEIVSRTKRVSCDANETDSNIGALRDFWQFAHGNTDYRAVWEAYLDLPSIEINDQWIEYGLKIGGDEQLKAPPYVRPNTPDDSLTEEEKKTEMTT